MKRGRFGVRKQHMYRARGVRTLEGERWVSARVKGRAREGRAGQAALKREHRVGGRRWAVPAMPQAPVRLGGLHGLSELRTVRPACVAGRGQSERG